MDTDIVAVLLALVAGAQLVALIYLVVRLVALRREGAAARAAYGELQRRYQSGAGAYAGLQAEHQAAVGARDALEARYRGVADAYAERQRVLGAIEGERGRLSAEFERSRAAWDQALRALAAQLQQGQGELAQLGAAVAQGRLEKSALDEEASLRSFGFYKPRYDFATSDRYEARLEQIRAQQKQLLKDGTAAACSIAWTVNGSVAEGRKQIAQTLKLMLRAVNGECDASIAKVRYNNVHVMEARIKKAFDDITGLVAVQSCRFSPQYLALKLQELYLAHEYKEKVQAEREEQRRIREQMRDEDVAQREIEKARADAAREEQRYAAALAKAREEVEGAAGARQAKLRLQVEELEQRLAQAQQTARAVAQAQLTRAGHVYVISNVGSFGEQIYKIGMTRRLDPQDRVDELGDASVPFAFDVHAMIRAQDAPALETALHRAFHARRVNRVNLRKEFFRVTLEEIAAEVIKLHGEVEFTRLAEAEDYRKSVAMAEAGTVLTPTPGQPYLTASPAPVVVGA